MTMPKFEAVAWRYELKAGEYTFAEKRYFDEAYVQRVIALHTAEQLAGAYEAGKRDAIPEGWVLVPKEPTEEMLRAPWLKIDEQTSFKLKTAHNYYKAMLAAAPKGEE